MTQKAKCPAEAATSKPGEVHLTPPKGKKNMGTNTTEAVLAASELPVDRVDRLAKELAEALNDWMAGEFMAVILPTSRGGDFPIMFGNIKSQREAIAHQAGRAI